MSAHASKPAATRRIFIVSESEDLRLTLAQLVSLDWPDAEIEDWDPGAPGPDGHSDPDVVLVDGGIAWSSPAAAAGQAPVIRLLDDPAAGLADGELTLPKARLSRAAVNAAVSAALAGGPGHGSGRSFHTAGPSGGAPSGPFLPGGPEAPRLNGFQTLRRLGTGGMSTIFLAQHLARGIPMALKIMDSHWIEDKRLLDLFLEEYNLISHIDSPYIVRIYEQGFTDEHVYIAMEYFPNGDLKERLRPGALPATMALRVFCQVLRSLEVIHGHGIAHRDLKPQNIMFRQDGSLALIDFGIARHSDAAPETDAETPTFGTPYYMSPEQCEGLSGDHRSDLYSAGTILYEMLTGTKPYTGRTAVEVMAQHIGAPIPCLPSPFVSYQPLLERLLAKDPGDRYRDAGVLVRALDKLSPGY